MPLGLPLALGTAPALEEADDDAGIDEFEELHLSSSGAAPTVRSAAATDMRSGTARRDGELCSAPAPLLPSAQVFRPALEDWAAEPSEMRALDVRFASRCRAGDSVCSVGGEAGASRMDMRLSARGRRACVLGEESPEPASAAAATGGGGSAAAGGGASTSATGSLDG